MVLCIPPELKVELPSTLAQLKQCHFIGLWTGFNFTRGGEKQQSSTEIKRGPAHLTTLWSGILNTVYLLPPSEECVAVRTEVQSVHVG